MSDESSEIQNLLERVRAGDQDAMNELFTQHRDRLHRMVELRLDRRVQARIDASDVIQDAYLRICKRIDEYLKDPKMPVFLWFRLIVGEQIIDLHRHHLGVQMRDAQRDISLYEGALPAATSVALAAQLLGKHTSPTQAAVRAERLIRIQEALNSLEPVDKEVLALRHFEQLNRKEAAEVLGITEAAAAKRYIRALKKMKQILAEHTEGLENL